MKQEEIKNFEGKKVRIKTNSGFLYQTDSIVINEDSIQFKDKYDNEILISINDISLIMTMGVNNGNQNP